MFAAIKHRKFHLAPVAPRAAPSAIEARVLRATRPMPMLMLVEVGGAFKAATVHRAPERLSPSRLSFLARDARDVKRALARQVVAGFSSTDWIWAVCQTFL